MEIIKGYKAKIYEQQCIGGKDIFIVWNNISDKIPDISYEKLILVGDNPGHYKLCLSFT